MISTFRGLFLFIAACLFLISDLRAQMIGTLPERDENKVRYSEGGVNAFVLSRRLFNFNSFTSESVFVPVYGPGFFYKYGGSRRLLRLSLNYIRFVSSVRTDRNFFYSFFNGSNEAPVLFSHQELEVKVGVQRFAKKQSAVQRYVAHDFSYGYGIEKVDGFPSFSNSQYGISTRQAFSLSQMYGLRYSLSPDLILNVETGLLVELVTLKNTERRLTQSSIKWRALSLSLGFRI